MAQEKIWDSIIVGAGPAGLTAALYGARRKMTVLVLTKDIGGQAAMTNSIENYPGFINADGPSLMNTFYEQAKKWGAEVAFKEVSSIDKQEDGTFIVAAGKETFLSRTVVLAFGLEHRKMEVKGEAEYYGKGVTYCATCDGPLFKNKIVAVVGGGNSALDAAEYLSKIAKEVHLLVRGPKFRGEQVMIDAVTALPNIHVHFETSITEVVGGKFVEKVKLVNNETKAESELPLNGIFVEIGYKANTKLYGHLAKTTEQGAIIVEADCSTSLPGFFAAGDVTTLPYKQIITSGGEGCKAILTAYAYLQKQRGQAATFTADHYTK